jgi:hypothetical protein
MVMRPDVRGDPAAIDLKFLIPGLRGSLLQERVRALFLCFGDRAKIPGFPPFWRALFSSGTM